MKKSGFLSYMVDWAERVMARLALLNKSQADLARHLGISKQSVSMWKTKATRSPEAHHLVQTAEFLGTTERWILFGRDPRCCPNGKLKKAPCPKP
jgi:transcriptional regulator with XRE-family HTH domain